MTGSTGTLGASYNHVQKLSRILCNEIVLFYLCTPVALCEYLSWFVFSFASLFVFSLFSSLLP